MQKSHPNMGTGNKPFPDARRSQALREEDAFMHMHGGAGSRSIFYLVNKLSTCVHLTSHLPAVMGRFILQIASTLRTTASENRSRRNNAVAPGRH